MIPNGDVPGQDRILSSTYMQNMWSKIEGLSISLLQVYHSEV